MPSHECNVVCSPKKVYEMMIRIAITDELAKFLTMASAYLGEGEGGGDGEGEGDGVGVGEPWTMPSAYL